MKEPFPPKEIGHFRSELAEQGYLILPAFFAPNEIDAVLAATEAALRTRGMEIVVDNLLDGERTFYGLARNRESQNFKINDLYLSVAEVRQLALEERLSELLRALLDGMRPVLCNTLSLIKGSGQPIHIDSLFMTPQTPQHLVAAWIAFEDVDPVAGPLVYYPGSHRIPLYRFRDGSHHASNDELPAWTDYIQREIERRGFEKKIFLARKGDVFIWHADLAHGGVPIQDARKTRRSLVCHYFTESDARNAPGWRLDSLNSGFWLNRLPPAARPPPDRFDDAHPFPEEAYLRRNSDLREALADGRITSGLAHYRSYGYTEGREI
jgi:ectoine hydroxylase-related dioxygenase (phytanoyl-CoA dioxygenase family)